MKIVCLEGCSGTGKTTQYHSLNDYFVGSKLKHLAVVEKNYEPFKTVVNEWHRLKGPTVPFTENDIRRFAEARAETFLKRFSKYENEINLIMMDRYFYTSSVYQRNSTLNPIDILKINIDYGSPIPDLTFLFDCDPKICFQRSNERNQKTGGRHLFSTSPEKIGEIRKEYLNLAKVRKEVEIIDTHNPISEVTKCLITKISELF